MVEETSFRKVVAKAAVVPKGKGFMYFVDTKTGDVIETDMTHPDYAKYKEAKKLEKEAKLRKKQEDEKARKQKILDKIAEDEEKLFERQQREADRIKAKKDKLAERRSKLF